ncbi:glucuronate isomerase [Actinoplanes sp. TRM88002]|uniref:Uronate isomerase n=1 Tax=Paractinoplanes hotanensis TaxID=2906497 RepID=A0ABT0Y8I1_9ACTN|nr:glucuronate isomerase [Actinoplanes hotanensis]MCM4082100.1 glucuronate isomerase [Actinoplanes hotanensis]
MPDPILTTDLARELHAVARDLPLISPHGHVDPALLADDQPFEDPARLLIVPDHYVTRMLLSQGIPPDRLGVPRRDGGPVETDPRTIWRLLAANWHLFRGTPSRLWLEQTFRTVFEVETPLRRDTADEVYDAIAARLTEPAFRPRALFERFGLEVLATTESPTDDLARHAKLAADGWEGRVISTFRPDDVVDLEREDWAANVGRMGELAGEDTGTYAGYLAALRVRRQDFIAIGTTSSDHGHPTARTVDLSPADAAKLYDRALRGETSAADAETFRGHMILEFARMSIDDGLVMQLHPGASRDHNRALFAAHGRDVGGDIPQATDYVHALRPLLEAYGMDPRLRVVLYTLDETAFSRELAPLAGGYPALFLGAPWWFLDTPDAMRRFREAVTDAAGFYNTAGFVDDTRAFCSIPVRHDVARRVDAAYLATLVEQDRLPFDEAAETMADLAYHLPKRIFKLEKGAGA